MKNTKEKTKLELLSLDQEGQVSLQDNYLNWDDIYVVNKAMVDDKTWNFALKSGVSLREASFLQSAQGVLKEGFQNLTAKQFEKQSEILDLYLETFKKADFLSQSKLWNLMEDVIAEDLNGLKPEFKRLLLKILLDVIPYCLTHNLRGEFLIWLLPAEGYAGLVSKETPKALRKLLNFYKLFSRKQLFLLLKFAASLDLLDLESERAKEIFWWFYFGPDSPENGGDQFGILSEARNQESGMALATQCDTTKVWEFFQEDNEENRLAVIEYFRREIANSCENSTALLELLKMFGKQGLGNTEKFHILRALAEQRSFYNPIELRSYRAVDYLALIELFNTYAEDRDLIMVYLSDHKDLMEGLKAQLTCEIEALRGEENVILRQPYEQFQKNYREWFLRN